MTRGMTLIELLISMAVFAILATSTTAILTSTLRGAARSELGAKIRADGTYIMDVMATNIRYATNIACAANSVVVAQKSLTAKTTYACTGSTITANAVSLNSADTTVSGCSIVCNAANNQVTVSFSLQDTTGVIAPVGFSSQIVLRNK